MSKKQKILDELSVEKNKITERMSAKEKKEADIYFEEVVKELTPFLENLDKIIKDEKLLNALSSAFKKEIKDQKWHEKLSETFYNSSNS